MSNPPPTLPSPKDLASNQAALEFAKQELAALSARQDVPRPVAERAKSSATILTKRLQGCEWEDITEVRDRPSFAVHVHLADAKSDTEPPSSRRLPKWVKDVLHAIGLMIGGAVTHWLATR